MHISWKTYGETQTGQSVYEYTMANSNGMKVTVLNLGGIITRIHVPDRRGIFKNVVLALNSLHDYEEDPAYIGAIVGRYAGRIQNGVISIDGKEYGLDKNDGENTLHGGFIGLNKVIWEVEERAAKDTAELSLIYLSRDGEGGFPGNIRLKTIYRLYEDNSLEITFEGISDKKTAISLTNHSYFNLSGAVGTVEEHNLRVNTPFLLELDKDMLAGEKVVDIREYGINSNNAKPIKKYMDAMKRLSGFRGIDHTFMVERKNTDGLDLAAEYRHQDSGRSLSVYTDLPYINIYSGNFLDEKVILKDGVSAVRYGGICFETEEQPDGPNHPGLGYRFLEPDKLYKRSTIFKFTIE